MTSVKITVQDAVLTAIENLVTPRVELAMKSANAHSERNVDGNVMEPDQRDFLSNIEGLRTTASSRINSHTDLNRIDETRSYITVEEGDFLVNEKNIDRQTYADHSFSKKSSAAALRYFLSTVGKRNSKMKWLKISGKPEHPRARGGSLLAQ